MTSVLYYLNRTIVSLPYGQYVHLYNKGESLDTKYNSPMLELKMLQLLNILYCRF
jgi:hypothetical protein